MTDAVEPREEVFDSGPTEISDGDNPEEEPSDSLTRSEEADLLEAEATADSVAYSGQDFDVNGLVRRLDNGDILIPTFGHNDERIVSAGFQRAFVWRRPQMDRFIESILLGYPIPGIFLVRQADRRYLVLDGQQRLKTLQFFHEGVFDGKEFILANVADRFRGLTYKTLPETYRRQFDDTFLQATIVSTDGTIESLEAIYKIFERVNSGGTQLTPHEIRVALFAGPFIDFLEALNSNSSWRSLYGKRSPRLRDQEIILRVLGLYSNAATYKRPLKAFLNGYVASRRSVGQDDALQLKARFDQASELLAANVGRAALRLQSYQVNAALTEALYVGMFRRLDSGGDLEPGRIAAAVQDLKSNSKLVPVVTRATADEESVRLRLELTTVRFAEV